MIHQVVPTLHKQLGGVDVAVRGLCRALKEGGTELSIHSLTSPPEEVEISDVTVYSPLRFSPARLGYSPAMLKGLRATVKPGDLIHNHGLWMMPNLYAGWVATEQKRPLIISPHGTLAPWALSRSRRIKWLIGKLGQWRVLESASCFHVTAESELEHLRNLGFSQPAAVIPNGVALPFTPEHVPERNHVVVLYLARLHPGKGLELLLRVWQRIEAVYRSAELQVAGPDQDGYGASMQELARTLGLEKVRFVGPLIGGAKDIAYASADIYVLPTHSENFGLTVAEALAAGTPVITTTGAPWKGLLEHECGWWIDRNEEQLFAAISAALLLGTSGLAEMGARGRCWMEQEYSWQTVAGQMNQFYEWLSDRNQKPAFVA